MIYVKANGNIVEEFPYGLRELLVDNPNVSFPKRPTEELLASYGVFMVHVQNQPYHDEQTQKLVEQAEPSLVNSRWELGWDVVDKTQEEITADTDNQEELVRAKRNSLLTSSDWTQLSDAPLTQEDKSLWASYRQALRDITVQAGFPYTVTWPEAP